MPDDDLDRDVASAFAALDRIEPPDLSARIFTEAAPDSGTELRALAVGPRVRPPRHRWLAGIAAAVALFGAGLAVGLLVRDSGSDAPTMLIDPPPTAAPPPTASPTVTSRPPADGTALVTPSVVQPGGTIAVTPDGAVDPECVDLAGVYRGDNGKREGLLAPDGGWTPWVVDGPPPTFLACERYPSSETAEYVLAGDLGPGSYVICIGASAADVAAADSRACGSFAVAEEGGTLAPDAPPTDPLVTALVDLDADLAGAPTGAASLDGATWCGSERRFDLDPNGALVTEPARRCFLDAHLAAAPAVFVTGLSSIEGDPIVYVWRTLADGTVELFTDASRDNFGSGQWESQSCARLATKFPGGPDGNPPTTFGCTDDGGDVLSPLYTAMPSWFTSREVLPLCGYAVRLVDVDTVQRDCFAQAIADRRPAEFAYADVSGGARTARWFRVTTAGAFEVIEQTITAEAGAVWQRYACTVIDTVDGADPGWVNVPFLDPTHCNVGVDAVPPSATSTPATVGPTAPPGTIRGDAAPPPT